MDAAHSLYRCMNGLFPLYKPPNKSMKVVCNAISLNLANALNKMQCRPMRPRLLFNHNPHLPSVTTTPDLSDHPLVVGIRYTRENFKLQCVDALTTFASGVTVIALNGGRAQMPEVINAKLMKVYHIACMLGKATTDHKESGKVLERSTHDHVTLTKLERVLSGVQASHQRLMFEASGVDLQSPEAYQLAQQGLVRPCKDHIGPVIYAIRCISFRPPHFTLEVHCINHTDQALINLVHNLGVQLRTNATCVQLRRLRYGMFTLDDSLLPSQARDPLLLVETLAKNRVDFSAFKNNPSIAYLSEGVAVGVGG